MNNVEKIRNEPDYKNARITVPDALRWEFGGTYSVEFFGGQGDYSFFWIDPEDKPSAEMWLLEHGFSKKLTNKDGKAYALVELAQLAATIEALQKELKLQQGEDDNAGWHQLSAAFPDAGAIRQAVDEVSAMWKAKA